MLCVFRKLINGPRVVLSGYSSVDVPRFVTVLDGYVPTARSGVCVGLVDYNSDPQIEYAITHMAPSQPRVDRQAAPGRRRRGEGSWAIRRSARQATSCAILRCPSSATAKW